MAAAEKTESVAPIPFQISFVDWVREFTTALRALQRSIVEDISQRVVKKFMSQQTKVLTCVYCLNRWHPRLKSTSLRLWG